MSARPRGEPVAALAERAATAPSAAAKPACSTRRSRRRRWPRFGLAVPAFRVADAADAPGAAAAIGFPVVVKALSSAHRAQERRRRRQARSPRRRRGRRSDRGDGGFERPFPRSNRCASGALAEVIVGVTRDSQFGLSLTFGAGGVLVDLLDDHATLILPAAREEIERALRQLRLARLLEGYRGDEARRLDGACRRPRGDRALRRSQR